MHDTDISDMQKIMVIPCECHIEPPECADTLPSEGTMFGISKNLRSATCLAANPLVDYALGMAMMIDRFNAACRLNAVTGHVQSGHFLHVVVVVVCICGCRLRGSPDGIVRPRESTIILVVAASVAPSAGGR